MNERKLFCLIKETDLPEAHADAENALEKLGTHQCGCGWPEQPCLSMQADLRQKPVIVHETRYYMPAWQAPWNKRKVPVRSDSRT